MKQVLFIVIALAILVLVYYLATFSVEKQDYTWKLMTLWAYSSKDTQHPEQHQRVVAKQTQNDLYKFHIPPKMCDAKLNSKPKSVHIEPVNYRPSFTEYSSGCPQQFKAADPDAPMRGTGVGEPAFPDINSLAQEYTKQCVGCKPTQKPTSSIPDPRDESTDNDFETVEYESVEPKVAGFVCQRPSGVGTPNDVYEPEFAEFKT
jgi:hypothetical protein